MIYEVILTLSILRGYIRIAPNFISETFSVIYLHQSIFTGSKLELQDYLI